MWHERALRYALAGGPMPADAAEHMAACGECRSELEQMRALERSLAAAAPFQEPDRGWEKRLSQRLLADPRSARNASSYGRWVGAAAGILLACGLALSLWHAAPGPGASQPAASSQAQKAADWTFTAADSTTALLTAMETQTSQQAASDLQPDLRLYLQFSEGDWNG